MQIDVRKKQPIEAGLVKNLSGKLSEWLKTLGKFIDKIAEWDPAEPMAKGQGKSREFMIEMLPSGITYSEEEQQEGNYPYRLIVRANGDDDTYRYFDLAVRPTKGSDKDVQSETNVKVALPDVSEDADEDEIQEANKDFEQRIYNMLETVATKLLHRIDKNIDNAGEMHIIRASVKVNLQKVQCSIGATAELQKITSDYSLDDTLQVIDDVLHDPDFVESLPEESSCFEIIPVEDGYDVSPCEACEIDICDNINTILTGLYNFWAGCKYLGWNCRGQYSGYLENACSMYSYEAERMIDVFAKMHWRYCNSAPYPAVTEQITIDQDPIDTLQKLFSLVIDPLELYICNFPEEDKILISQFLSDLIQYRDYTLAKMKG